MPMLANANNINAPTSNLAFPPPPLVVCLRLRLATVGPALPLLLLLLLLGSLKPPADKDEVLLRELIKREYVSKGILAEARSP